MTFRWGAGSGWTTENDTFYNISQGPVYTAGPPDVQPIVPNYGQFLVKVATESQTNVVIGDSIKFNDQWSALLGVNYATIAQQSFNTVLPPYGLNSEINQSKLTPTYSLIYKPVSWVTTYATYSESLQAGLVVPSTPAYTNSGQILPPYLGKEYEIGAKANVGGVLLTAAWFNIDKANQYAQPNAVGLPTYVQDGREVHQGVELTATGNIAPGLRILGGVTMMDAKVVQTASITTDNKRPVNVADNFAKATLEYDFPFLRGLTLTGGVYYVGKAPADVVNATWLASYVTADISLRYRTTLPTGQEAIWRLNVKNVANHAHWISNTYVGAPRVVAFSGTIRF
jgi:iron complex outermembrane receptor protein